MAEDSMARVASSSRSRHCQAARNQKTTTEMRAAANLKLSASVQPGRVILMEVSAISESGEGVDDGVSVEVGFHSLPWPCLPP